MLAASLVAGALGLLTGLLLAPPAAPAATAQEIVDAPRIRDAIEAAIDPDTRRGVPRLPRVTVDATGDVTVVVALRDVDDDLEATYAAALDDTGIILYAVYHSPEADRITSTTVVGTFNVIGATGRPRELPVLRAVLSAERATQLDWSALDPDAVPEVIDTWWTHAAFHGRETLLGEE